MAAAGDVEEEPPPPPPAEGRSVMEKLEEQWRKTKEHAETYPYVWSSYILVYGGLTAYITWRWRKLRRTEDRVRALQTRLGQLRAPEESQTAPPHPPPRQPPPAGLGKPNSGP